MVINYEESILTYIASIRKYYGLKSSYDSNELFDKILSESKPRQIILLLMDGMGANLLKKKLSPDAFLNRNMVFKTCTVFPSATTAATTAILNGKGPNENGWLGWSQYVEEINDVIIPFKGKGFYNGKDYGSGYFYDLMPVKNMVQELNDRDIKARSVLPSFAEDGYDSFTEMAARLAEMSHDEEYRFIYAYFDRYDSLMHRFSPDSKWCSLYLQHVNDAIELLAEELDEDTMLVYTADHGQITVTGADNLYPEFEAYFYRKPALEPRCVAFYVRDGFKEDFARKFKERYENDFILLTHDEVLKTKLFGTGKDHPRFEEFIGDFIAIGKSGLCLYYRENDSFPHIGMHGGMCEDEIMVPVGVFKK